MAKVVLGLGTSHSPLLSVPSEHWALYAERDPANGSLYSIRNGRHVDYEELLAETPPEIAKELTQAKFDARHQANQAGIAKVARKIEDVKPDVIVMFDDDQSETFNKDQMPAMALFWQDEVPFKYRIQRRDDESMQWAKELYGSDQFMFPVNSSLGRHMVESLSG